MLAIVAAFHEEVKDYLKRGHFQVAARDDYLRFYQSSSGPQVVVEGGLGRERAEEATRQLIDRYKPGFIICAGFAGAVREGIKVGDLFICDRLMSIDGPAPLWRSEDVKEHSIDNAALVDNLVKGQTDPENAHQEYALGGCLSVPELVPSRSTKEWIGSTFSVDIIDMESYWVSEIAAAHGIPHAVVRSVLDTMEQTLPVFVGAAVHKGKRWGHAVKYMLANPTEAPKLITLASQARIARASLGRFLATLASHESILAMERG